MKWVGVILIVLIWMIIRKKYYPQLDVVVSRDSFTKKDKYQVLVWYNKSVANNVYTRTYIKLFEI